MLRVSLPLRGLRILDNIAMTRIVTKRDYVMRWKDDCGPNIDAKIKNEKKQIAT